MASINKLSIRGVRSFSPDDAEQVLEFYFPCTIIVGANGCGKTTIIESLKFAVSGCMPPGNKSGQAFVHDPRALGQSSVKANIKLRFTGRAGNSMVVVRGMEVQQKKTTMTFKQLDGVLRSTDRDGNRVSMGHKCSELDRQLPLLLGVSRATLEHVVFCHQEDSSWPLQEGAVLKKRFDDIFDSTRYSKALEVFAKLRKDYTAEVKDIKADLAGISSHRHAAKGFREELAKYNEQMEQVEEEIGEQKETLKGTEKEQSRLDAIMEQMDEINTELESRKNEYATQKQVVKKQSSMLQEDLTKRHSLSELKEMLRDFDAQRGHQLEQKADLEDQLGSLQKELRRIQQQESDLQSRVGRLEAAKEAHKQNLRARFDKMVEIGEVYALGDVLTAVTQSQQNQTQSTMGTASGTNRSALDVSMAMDDQAPILDISQKDMEEFFRAVAKKEDELKETIKRHRETYQKTEDALNDQISDVMAKIKSIQSSREKLNKKQTEARKELKQISDTFQNVLSVRKSDIEETRQQAARFAKERDQANSDPRKNEIPIEIRDIESKLDHLKLDLEDDRIALKYLRQTSDTHQAIAVLRGQCVKDLEILEETTKDFAYVVQSFNLATFPKKFPTLEEIGNDGDRIRDIFNKVLDEVREKYDSQKLSLDRASADVVKLQQFVSERRVLLGHDEHLLDGKRGRLAQLEASGGAVSLLSGVLEELRAHEVEIRVPNPYEATTHVHPRELLVYLSDRLAEEESQSTESIPADIVRKVFSRLIKQAKVDDDKFACPCCTRIFEAENEFQDFRKQLKMLASEQSPLVKVDERNKASKAKYIKWKEIVTENTDAIMEYHRITKEVHDLATNTTDLENRLSDSMRQLDNAKEAAGDVETQVESLRDLLDSAKRWSEAAVRIAEKRMLITQKEEELDMSIGVDTKGRDLMTVEREMNDRIEEREQHTAKMNRLNKEMSALMARINTVTGQASRMEQLVQEKERKMAEEQRLIKQKHDLTEVIADCASEEKKLQEQLASLTQKQKYKETEKSRMRALNNEEDDRISSTMNSFIGAVKELRSIDSTIERYQSSTTEDELLNVDRKSAEFVKKAEEKKEQINAIVPELDRLVKAVEDQERCKKNLKENIEIIIAKDVIEKLVEDISRLEGKLANMDGHETVYDDIAGLRSRRELIIMTTATLEGRRGEILESVRSIKRKLSAPEYKDVDEEYRVAMIKYETTQMAVKDLEKYHSALDKALLKFHSVKIGEINKIIRDLWNLTYKGEDITSIEIVSGQESGSRATRSYNYRVVMTKGSTQLDMRGRCSAGQRVLASIVIRLALAETFCVNFGCIALDEPTVNLDYNNKKGLAIALAQIIASRARQSNFQLVLITHDEDFVAMMKNELSLQSGFQMPEKYFQVRREEGADGKFYSKIDAIDWEELL